MEFDQVIAARRSIRKFDVKKVAENDVDALLEAARLAPSGSNTQPWRFVIVTSEETRAQLAAVTRYRFALRAPLLFVCCADMRAVDSRPRRISELVEAGVFNDVEIDGNAPDSVRQRDAGELKAYLSMNVGIAIEHIILKATDLGLGSCWIGGFNGKMVKDLLDLDDNLYVVALLPIGHPLHIPAPRPRFASKNLVVKRL